MHGRETDLKLPEAAVLVTGLLTNPGVTDHPPLGNAAAGDVILKASAVLGRCSPTPAVDGRNRRQEARLTEAGLSTHSQAQF
jgi:hypothetical protein